MKKLLLLVVLCVCQVQAATPNDLEFLEAFAWGDRSTALKELVPDTEEYYYYHCLHYQLIGDDAAFETMLQKWLGYNKNHWNSAMQEMRRRQQLLNFSEHPADTWAFLRNDLDLRFNHRPRDEKNTTAYPSKLDPRAYGQEVFMKRAQRDDDLSEFTERGLELALTLKLSPEQRRSLLARLTRPDYPGLVQLIADDLAFKDSRGFGSLPVHHLLTRDQLIELEQRRPALLREQSYVTERLARMTPPDVDMSHDHEAAIAHFQSVWTFVQRLEPMHNSLKASVLYRLLDHLRQVGRYDEELFITYLNLPRQVPYLARDRRIQLQRERASWVNFGFHPGGGIVLPPIGNEEDLVRDVLLAVLKDAPDTERYAEIFEDNWLDAVFAESKILHGIGKPAQWAARLSPAAYRAIIDRVELNFAPGNPAYIRPGDAVSLKLAVKRVDQLLVKIFEVQTFNYYTTHRAPVDQAIDLDGMVATHQRTMDVSADPARRILHTLDLPEITERGVYVVELIGNGVSSRALVHVGMLETITRPTAFGQAVLVLNDAGDIVENAAIWLDGREFTAGDKGLVLLPYSEHPGVRFMVLRDGEFCSPEQLQHLGESYTFSAGIHLDAQDLQRRQLAALTLRPDLRLNGMPVDPSLMKDVVVTLASIDTKGNRTEREFPAEFLRDQEWTKPFYVPDGIRRFEVAVRGTVERKRDLEKEDLNDQFALNINQGRSTDTLRQLFLTPHAEGWILEARGLNGEALANLPLEIDLLHPGFTDNVDLNATTDADGRVNLGPLTDLHHIRVTGPDNLSLDVALPIGMAVLPPVIHALTNEEISLPNPFTDISGLAGFSLWQVHDGKILGDLRDKLQSADRQLQIKGLPAGDYTLTQHATGQTVALKVRDGQARHGYILGDHDRLQQTPTRLPSLASLEKNKTGWMMTIRNQTPSTRVAVRLSRYVNPGSEFPSGQGYASVSARKVYEPHVQYISGRNIGDEYRYVLDRRLQNIYAGSLLDRPGLILNPWELRETFAEREQLKQDEAYRGGRQQLNAPAEALAMADQAFGGIGGRARRTATHFGAASRANSNIALAGDIGFDFLPEGSTWWVNLVPDENGQVALPRDNPGEHTLMDVVVIDRFGTSSYLQPLADNSVTPRDLRLTTGLDPEQTFSRQKTIQTLEAGQTVTFPDLGTTRHHVLRTVAQAYDLLRTLGQQDDLAEFEFLKDWPSLDDAAKLEKYGEFASHELHLFIYARDKAFFDDVVKPYLANKKDKTFVDRWLLDELTAEDTRLDNLQNRNALELALLARRGGDGDVLRDALREAWELIPPDPEARARRIQTALQAGDLDEAAAQRDAVREEAKDQSNLMQKMKRGLGKQEDGRMASLRKASADSTASFSGNVAAPAAAPVMSFAAKEMTMDELEEIAEPFGDPFAEMDLDGFAGELYDNQRLYRALPRTKELVEQNYYHVRATEDVPARVPVNTFWRDVAAGVAVSPHLLEAHGSLTEVIAALAFSGLPFESDEADEQVDGAQLTLTAPGPCLLISEQVLPAEQIDDGRPLLLSQQFFRPDDPYRFEGNERIEKFIQGEFIRRTAYGARVTLTNPTASRRRLNVLQQIPLGAVPVRNGFYTDDQPVALEPYTTRTLEYYFYFPESGSFNQFPAHAAVEEAIVGRADPRLFTVVDAPTEIDKTSWAWISQHGTERDVLDFLSGHNLRRLDLNDIAWRMKDKAFFSKVTDLLATRAMFHDTLFSYALFHQDTDRATLWLSRSRLKNQVGPVLESDLLTIIPVEQRTYEHLEYDPLVNPRVHPVGEHRKILNTALNEQYRKFLHQAMYRSELDAHEKLALVYYLQLQDRLSEAGERLTSIQPGDVQEQLQLDYLRAWMALRNLDLESALALATPHTGIEIPRWQSRFAALMSAIEQARGGEALAVDDPNRQQDIDRQAASQPSLDMELAAGTIQVTAHNLPRATLNLYPMDIELLFSRKPFLAADGGDFAVIKPAYRREVKLDDNGEPHDLELPDEYRDRNVMVELRGKGQRASVAWYANRLRVRKIESYGQIEVRSDVDGTLQPKTYVKVYARGVDGRESFWKDGYTDLRGRFDYLSLNDRQPEDAAEFSILVLHPDLGAVIRDAAPPVR